MKLLCLIAASSASAEQGGIKYKAGGYLETESIDMSEFYYLNIVLWSWILPTIAAYLWNPVFYLLHSVSPVIFLY